ncbi:Protein OSB2, chloroplastic [Glycine soja]
MVGHIGWGRTQVINQNEPMLNVKNKITEFPRSGRMEVMARLLAAETFSHTVVVQVKPKHPDFKRKDRNSLWLGKDEKWVLPKLEGLQFDVPTAISKKGDGGEPCNDLVQNYANWWDNRLNKRNAKAPDFKHKETGKGLWLDSSSEWVLEKLPPPLKPKQSVDTERTLVS